MSKIAKSADPETVYFGSLQQVIDEYDLLHQTYRIIVAYGGESKINLHNIEPIFKPYVDYVLVCPQVRFKTPILRKMLTPVGIPCEDIEMRTFGRMDGKKALDDILALAQNLER
ncbi:PTS sugar transporter subunit IIB [Enterococcus rivorum]|uniref:PTS sugar transporter subunit IIB n=1 Tax=Enterococcus rivorum TaxID=762845 RepID=UPI003625AD36